MAKEIVLKPIKINSAYVTIEGDSDLILNKMNNSTKAALIEKNKSKAKTIADENIWENIITSMHWRDELPKGEYTEKTLKELLKKNAPCISAFGLKKSFGDAVVRNGLDKHKTKFDANVNVTGQGGLVPIKYAEHFVDEKLIKTRMGAPVLSRQNRFTGWSAKFEIQYMEGGAYQLEQIIQIISLAGFGLGIGSGRSSGFGRYHVTAVEG